MIAVASGFSTAHAVLTPSAQPHVPALSRSTVPLCPRICLRIQVQLRVLDALKAPLALEDQLVQDPHPRIQVRMPDSVGVKQVAKSCTCPAVSREIHEPGAATIQTASRRATSRGTICPAWTTTPLLLMIDDAIRMLMRWNARGGRGMRVPPAVAVC